MSSDTKCGFIALIGLPNAGKSTLMNKVIGAKVSIISKKPQTTRSRVLGIITEGAAQMIFIDTPGIFKPTKTLERAMVGAALDAIPEADIAVHLIDASRKNVAAINKDIAERLTSAKPRKLYLVLNKVDQMDKEGLLAMSAEMNAAHDYDETFMISGLKGAGLAQLVAAFARDLPQGAWHYDEDELTDMPMRLLAAELTREKVFQQLHEELPYEIFVETESWEEFDNGDLKISQAISVEKDSQKGIVLGKGGSRIKALGQASRLELEEMLERRVHLKLFVKVQKNWADREENLRQMGLSRSD